MYIIFLQYGLVPLHLAAKSGHEGLVRLLLNCPGVQADTVTMIQVIYKYTSISTLPIVVIRNSANVGFPAYPGYKHTVIASRCTAVHNVFYIFKYRY